MTQPTFDFFQFGQTLFSAGAVLIAARALWHTRATSATDRARRDGQTDGRSTVTLEEFAEKFNRAFDEIEKLGDRFRLHDLQCTREKTLLAERQAENAKAMASVVDRLENLSRQMGYVGRDMAKLRSERQGIKP